MASNSVALGCCSCFTARVWSKPRLAWALRCLRVPLPLSEDVWDLLHHAVRRDGYTIGYYGRPFEARNKVSPGPLYPWRPTHSAQQCSALLHTVPLQLVQGPPVAQPQLCSKVMAVLLPWH